MEVGLDSFDERLKKKEVAATNMDGLKRNRKRNISYLKKTDLQRFVCLF
jgi:hypothetical protein